MNNNKDIFANPTQLKKELLPLFAGHPDIEAAYLFGSAVRGNDGPVSDIDVAIRCTFDLSPESCFELRLEFMEALEKILNRDTDIVVLNIASLKMIRQVLTHGILIYAEDAGRERMWAIQKQKEYFDFKYYIDQNRKELKSYFGAA